MGAPDKIIVKSDHKTLEHFLTTKTLTRRQARWALFLGEFSFVIEYKKGIDNIVADALSRRPDYQLTLEEAQGQAPPILNQDHFMQLNRVTTEIVDFLAQIRTATATDETAVKIQDTSDFGQEDCLWKLKDGVLFYDEFIYVPEGACRLSVLLACHDAPDAGHFGSRKTLELIRRDYYWPKMSSYTQHYVDSCETCNRFKHDNHKPYGLIQPLAITA